MSGIFKEYDIRGIYPAELNEQTAYKIGKASAIFMKKVSGKKKIKVAVGNDMRLSSPKLKPELIKGLLEQGADVIDIGMVSTPTFYFGVSNYGYDGGIMVSASHNPPQFNGFKVVKKLAEMIGGKTGLEDIQKLVEQNTFEECKKGALSELSTVLADHVNEEIGYADISKIKPLKVVVDAANGMGAQYCDALFKKLPCKLVKMFFEFDGSFPNHEADPFKDENNKLLQQRVVKEKADLGIAIDGDGDRIFFIDETGRTVPQHIIRGMVAQLFLREHKGAVICYDIRPGRITKEMIEAAGGKAVMTIVGHSNIKAKMKEVNAVFGGESSGHMFVKKKKGIYESPMIVILKVLQELSESGKAFSEYIQPYDIYFHSGEINSLVENKIGKMNEIEAFYKPKAKSINWLDGVTIDCGDFWFNVRPSNTENKLRLNLEAVSKAAMEKRRDEVLRIIRG